MFWVIQTLNGISFGMLLFLLAAGLSLIYGLMKILNLTHGSFYLLRRLYRLDGGAQHRKPLPRGLAQQSRHCARRHADGAPPAAAPASSGAAADIAHVRLPFHILRSCDFYLGRQPADDAEARHVQPVGSAWRLLLSFVSLVHHCVRAPRRCAALVAPGGHPPGRDAARGRRRRGNRPRAGDQRIAAVHIGVCAGRISRRAGWNHGRTYHGRLSRAPISR